MKTDSSSTIGVMFARNDNGEFPTVRSFGYSSDELTEFDNWLVVAYDPRTLMYADEDSEAMDVTNWNVLEGIVGELDTIDRFHRRDSRYNLSTNAQFNTLMGLARERGVCEFDVWMGGGSQRCLIVAPEAYRGEEAMDTLNQLRDCSRALADYPLLDEEGYCERESEAWDAYMADGLKFDTLRDLELDEDTEEALEEAWMETAGNACQYLHYYSGFTGEHGPTFGECLGDAIADALIAVTMGGTWSRWSVGR